MADKTLVEYFEERAEEARRKSQAKQAEEQLKNAQRSEELAKVAQKRAKNDSILW